MRGIASLRGYQQESPTGSFTIRSIGGQEDPRLLRRLKENQARILNNLRLIMGSPEAGVGEKREYERELINNKATILGDPEIFGDDTVRDLKTILAQEAVRGLLLGDARDPTQQRHRGMQEGAPPVPYLPDPRFRKRDWLSPSGIPEYYPVDEWIQGDDNVSNWGTSPDTLWMGVSNKRDYDPQDYTSLLPSQETLYDEYSKYLDPEQIHQLRMETGQKPLHEVLQGGPYSFLEHIENIYDTHLEDDGYSNKPLIRVVHEDEPVEAPFPLIEVGWPHDKLSLSGQYKAPWEPPITSEWPKYEGYTLEPSITESLMSLDPESNRIMLSPLAHAYQREGGGWDTSDPAVHRQRFQDTLAHEVYHSMSQDPHNYEDISPQDVFASAVKTLGRVEEPQGEWVGHKGEWVSKVPRGTGREVHEEVIDWDKEFQGPLSREGAMEKLIDLTEQNYRTMSPNQNLSSGWSRPEFGGPEGLKEKEFTRQLQNLLRGPVYRDHPIQRFRTPERTGATGIQSLTEGIDELGMILRRMGLGR